MKTATKGDKPDWFDRPSNIVAANVCRVSGKLPNGGCDHVEVVNRDGSLEYRSMIYTEYFVKGTQPSELCPLHPSPSFMDRVAGLFGAGDSNKPVRAEEAALPPTQTGTAGAHGATPPPPPAHVEEKPKESEAEAQPKKRGFWGRLFGKGDKKDDQKDDQKDQENQKERKKKKDR